MKKVTHILLFATLFLLNSCVKEKDVFKNDVINPLESTETSLIVSFLNEEFLTNSIDTQNCFSFNYPITIYNNTRQQFTVRNFIALEEIANSQSRNFTITGIVLPISITNNDNSASVINSIEDLNLVFDTCGILELRSALLEKTEECLKFQYPIEMLDNNEDIIIIENIDEFFEFLNNPSESRVTPEFIFPITTEEGIIINNYFTLYDILNNCSPDIEAVTENCVSEAINISTNEIATNLFEFSIDDENINYSEISWTINNSIITAENEPTLTYQFTEDGFYDICANTILVDCPDDFITQVCDSVEINTINDCIDLTFILEENEENSFIRITIFPESIVQEYDNISLEINNDIIGEVFRINEFIHFYDEPGIFEICLSIETEDCPNGNYVKCETIEIL